MLSATVVKFAELCGWTDRVDRKLLSDYLRSGGDARVYLRAKRALREAEAAVAAQRAGTDGIAATSKLPSLTPVSLLRLDDVWTPRRSSIGLIRTRVSHWSRSGAKRLFDCLCIVPVLPLLIPLFLVIGLAVRVTSRGPVLFLQKRMGRNGRTFTIVKFRTLEHREDRSHHAAFTPVGPFLRRWKLDELPQLWNVLKGDMSLVGARPKLPEHQIGELRCRPGITGAATLAFAREEHFLARLPKHDLDEYYREKILPLKHQIDIEYMARATFASDFKLLIDTVLRRWDTSLLEALLLEKTPALENSESVDRLVALVGIYYESMEQVEAISS
jgi:lipopolysaccharide/colanic/teichoic acid biosynthesis glycosyltransferase